MIHSLATRMASVFLLYGESAKEDSDIYTYACEAIISLLVNIVVCLIIASIFGRVADGIIFITVFALLRRYTGGYHAKTHFRCILTFGVILTCVMVVLSVGSWTQTESIVLVIATAAMIGIVAIAPADVKGKLAGRKKKLLVVALWAVCIADAYALNIGFGFVISLSMISVLGSLAYAMVYEYINLKGADVG